MSDTDVATFLKRHPRATSALLTGLLLLTQVQAVAAGGSSWYGGP